MKSWIMALGALTLAGTACNPVVLEPLKGAQSTGTGSTAAAGGGPGEVVMLAARAGDIAWSSDGLFGMNAPWSNPDSLVLLFSSDPQQCSGPVLTPRCSGVGTFWQAVVAIPPELAHPGMISVADPRINVYAAESFPDGSPTCGGGAFEGPILSGTIELVSNGSSALSVKLSGGVQVLGASTANGVVQPPIVLDGEYTAEICGALAPETPPTPALAVLEPNLSPPPGGGMAPADSLVVFAGTLPNTCQDPWAAADCTSASRLTFTLPAALQKPGVVSLSDPAIGAAYTVSAPGGSSTCTQPSGPLTNGTVEILSVDASGLTFKVYQSFTDSAATGGWYYFDGLYSAAICP
ncbi:MAG: hypothetical protein ABJE95_32170 [Byssovorax sp.]